MGTLGHFFGPFSTILKVCQILLEKVPITTLATILIPPSKLNKCPFELAQFSNGASLNQVRVSSFRTENLVCKLQSRVDNAWSDKDVPHHKSPVMAFWRSSFLSFSSSLSSSLCLMISSLHSFTSSSSSSFSMIFSSTFGKNSQIIPYF